MIEENIAIEEFAKQSGYINVPGSTLSWFKDGALSGFISGAVL